MDRNKIIAIWLLRRRCRKRQRNRLLWVHPINLERDQLREFDRQFEGLRCDENKFLNYFRMSISSQLVISIFQCRLQYSFLSKRLFNGG
jgi:hypothetical protein